MANASHIILPHHVGGGTGGQAFGDGLALLQQGESFVPVFLRHEDFDREEVIAVRQIPLPLRVRRVRLGQPLRDAERLAEQPLGLGQIPLRRRQIAELV